MIRSSLFCAASVLTVAAASPAFAQSSAAAVDEDNAIIVTAQLREQSIVDVPIAITALDGEFIERLGVSDFEEVSRYIRKLAERRFASAGLPEGVRYERRGTSARRGDDRRGTSALHCDHVRVASGTSEFALGRKGAPVNKPTEVPAPGTRWRQQLARLLPGDFGAKG